MLATTSSLADPVTRGEDLGYNYRLATAIAPQRCKGCARYHVNWPLGRLAGIRSPYGSDRDEFADTAAGLIRDRALSVGTIAILIAGAADTGVPALLAHTALKAGIVDRIEFVVVDRCDTPLQLCRDFAERHQLRLRTLETDIGTLEEEGTADIVVVHSLLRFVPADRRVACLGSCRRLLKPGGRMILSNTFAAQSGRVERSVYTDGLRALVERDVIELAEPREQFLARLEEEPPWQLSSVTETELHGLFRAAGLEPISITTVREGGSQQPVENRGRMIAVFAAT